MGGTLTSLVASGGSVGRDGTLTSVLKFSSMKDSVSAKKGRLWLRREGFKRVFFGGSGSGRSS